MFSMKEICRDQRIALVATLHAIAEIGYGKLPGWNREDLAERLITSGILKKSIKYPDYFEAKNDSVRTVLLSLNENSAVIN